MFYKLTFTFIQMIVFLINDKIIRIKRVQIDICSSIVLKVKKL